MPDIRLEYEDYRPIKRGEAGYSPTKRLMISPSTGDIISRRQFMNKATRVAIPSKKQAKAGQGKPRKTRADKGMSRKDYEAIRPLLRDFAKAKKRKSQITKETGKKRYDSAKAKHNKKQNIEREKRGLNPVPLDAEPVEPFFYDTYDILRHPEEYDSAAVSDALDYFWGDDYDEEYDYDYPLGETP